MKKFKRSYIVLSFALLAGIVTFVACGKDDTPTGTKAGNEMCDCASKTTESEILSCTLKWYSKYSDYIEIDFDFESDLESEDMPIKFKNSKFEKDFNAALAKCAAAFIEDED